MLPPKNRAAKPVTYTPPPLAALLLAMVTFVAVTVAALFKCNAPPEFSAELPESMELATVSVPVL